MGISIGAFIASLGSNDQTSRDFVAETIDSNKPLRELSKSEICTVSDAVTAALLKSDARLNDNQLSSAIIESGGKYVNAHFILEGITNSHVIIANQKRTKEG